MKPKDIYAALRDVLGHKPGIAVLHCSLLPLRAGGRDPNVRRSIVGAFERLSGEGWSLAVPTFTFSFCRGTPYHWLHSSSETGAVGRWLLERPDVRRTPHPIYSFAVMGPEADRISACASRTSFSTDSPFGLFVAADAHLVMLGAPWSTCTNLHYFEEEAQVPYRHYKDFEGTADFGPGAQSVVARMFVRDKHVGAEHEFAKPIAGLREHPAFRAADAGGLPVEAVPASALAKVTRAALGETPYALVRRPIQVAQAVRHRDSREREAPVRVALLASYNCQVLQHSLEAELRASLSDRRVELYTSAFGQASAEVLADDSPLWRWNPDYLIFGDRLEDALQIDSLDDASDAWPGALELHLSAVRRGAAKRPGRCFALGFALLRATALGSADAPLAPRRIAAAADASLRAIGEVHVIDVRTALAASNVADPIDDRLWRLGRIPWSGAATQALGGAFTGAMLAALQRTVRLLIVDLDNTLWGGVLGEDGVEGLRLGSDYPGNCFRAFQRRLKGLSERGVALALVSKNDEPSALSAMATHPEMVLIAADFAARRIDWQPKWRHVADIAESLGLGLANIGFVDDNPAEREEMRLNLPDVKVLDLPEDPAFFCSALLNWPWIACVALTAEDGRRSQNYVARRRVEESRMNFADPRDFFASLGIRLHLAPLSPGNTARAVQLMMKTNQFNTTTRRLGADDFAWITRDGGEVIAIGHEDRFSAFEVIGVAVIRWGQPAPDQADIHALLLSCRVLGRGIEQAVLHWLATRARGRGVRRLNGQIIPTERNTPVRHVYRDFGFAEAGDGWWSFDVAATPVSAPNGITIFDATQERIDA